MSDLTTYEDFRRELRWYEQAFPTRTFAETSLALTGQEPIDDMVADAEAALDGDAAVDLDPESEASLARSVRLLRALADRQVTTFSLRKYDTDEGETPADINQNGVENDSVMGFLAHGAAISATASVAVYTLSEQMHAICWNRETTGMGGFTVKVGAYHGGFDLAFTSNVDAYLQRNFYANDWRRPEHFTDSDDSPWVYDDPRQTA